MRSSSRLQRPAGVAGRADLDTVAEIITHAFASDPVWGPAFLDPTRSTDANGIWRAYLGSLMRFPWTWLSVGREEELPEPHWTSFDATLREHVGDVQAGAVVELFARFEAAHPTAEPHYYLSLLGTHPDHRGAGHGMRLLAENLERIDAERMPAYLESTNPGNDARYRRVGFEPVGSFEGFVPGSIITTMWRPARPRGS